MSTYLRLLRFLRPHAGVFALAVGCMLISSLLNGLQLGALIPLADRIITDKTIPAPAWLPGWIAGLVEGMNRTPQNTLLVWFAVSIPFLFMLKGLFDFWQTFYVNDAGQRVLRDIRQQMFDKFTQLSMDYHSKHPTGTTMSRIVYDTGAIQNSITEGVYDLAFQGFQVLVFLAVAVSISLKFAVIILLLAPLIALPMVTIGRMLKKLSQQTQHVMGQLNATILESIAGIEIVQAFSMEPWVRGKFAKASESYYRLNRKLQKRMNFLSPLTETVGAIGGALVFWYGGHAVLRGEMSLGTFFVFLGAILQLIRPLKRLSRLHSVNQQALAAAERIFEVLDQEPTVVEHPKARKLPPFHREISYEDVSFHYDSQPVLRGISLKIGFGETLAIVGPSGAGKTTLAGLLPRFYDPTAGQVKIDGINIKHITLSSLRDQIGLVTQDTTLFNDTVRANLAAGKPGATVDEMVSAAKAASAHAFITRLPKGYDTVIGERGDLLSGGERQRLAIARALLRNPSILILDEATSQLDAESEHLIQEVMEKIRETRTVILIAHRLSTVRLAHRIVLVQEGRIVESGHHDELLHKSPLYRRFCELQLMHAGPKDASSTAS